MKKWIGYVTMSLIAMALVLGLGTVAYGSILHTGGKVPLLPQYPGL